MPEAELIQPTRILARGMSDANRQTIYAAGGILAREFVFTIDLNQLWVGNTLINADLSAKADLVSGKVPASQLPSYVDDVLEFANLAGFPNPGEQGKIFVAIDTNKPYRWTGSAYVAIGGGEGTVTSIPDGSTNGISWTVANRTSTPTFTFTINLANPGPIGSNTPGPGTFATIIETTANIALGGVAGIDRIYGASSGNGEIQFLCRTNSLMSSFVAIAGGGGVLNLRNVSSLGSVTGGARIGAISGVMSVLNSTGSTFPIANADEVGSALGTLSDAVSTAQSTADAANGLADEAHGLAVSADSDATTALNAANDAATGASSALGVASDAQNTVNAVATTVNTWTAVLIGGSGLLMSAAGNLAIATPGSDYLRPVSNTGALQKSDGGGGLTDAVPGADFVVPLGYGTVSFDTGWTANVVAGDKTASIDDPNNLETYFNEFTAANGIGSDGSDDFLSFIRALAWKVCAIESSLRVSLLPHA